MSKSKLMVLGMGALISMQTLASGVYDDCVFFFDGGRDSITKDGLFQTGEFVDEMRAGVPSHDNHKATAKGSNLVWETGSVNFHAAGLGVQSLQYLNFVPSYTKDSGGAITAIDYSTIEMPFLKSLCPGNTYSAIFRVKRNANPFNVNQTLMSFGFDKTTAGHGWVLFITKDGDLATHCAESATPGTLTLTRKIGVDEWVDIGVSMNVNVVSYHVAFPGIDNTSTMQDGPSQIYHYTQTFRKTIGEDMYIPDTSMAQYFIRMGGQTAGGHYASTDGNGQKHFSGFVQRVAFWNRVLTQREMAEAFAFPRPSHVAIGGQNGHSDEFSQEDAATATIGPDLLQRDSWEKFPANFRAGDKRTIKFNMNAYDSMLSQLLVIKPTVSSPAGVFKVFLNGEVLSATGQMKSGQKFKFPIRAFKHRACFLTGENSLVIERVDSGASIAIDAIWLGGSWYVGKPDNCATAEFGWHYKTSYLDYLDTFSFARALNFGSAVGKSTCFGVQSPLDVTESYSARVGTRCYATGSPDADLNFCIDDVVKKVIARSGTAIDYWVPLAAGEHTVNLNTITGTTGFFWLDCHMITFDPPPLGMIIVFQ